MMLRWMDAALLGWVGVTTLLSFNTILLLRRRREAERSRHSAPLLLRRHSSQSGAPLFRKETTRTKPILYNLMAHKIRLPSYCFPHTHPSSVLPLWSSQDLHTALLAASQYCVYRPGSDENETKLRGKRDGAEPMLRSSGRPLAPHPPLLHPVCRQSSRSQDHRLPKPSQRHRSPRPLLLRRLLCPLPMVRLPTSGVVRRNHSGTASFGAYFVHFRWFGCQPVGW